MVLNRKPTIEWLLREDTSIPTASLKDIFKTEKIDEFEVQDIMILDVTNKLIKTKMPTEKYVK